MGPSNSGRGEKKKTSIKQGQRPGANGSYTSWRPATTKKRIGRQTIVKVSPEKRNEKKNLRTEKENPTKGK